MTGHIRRRGERSWEIKFDLGTDPLTGRRKTKYHSFKGTKREAEAELTRLKAAADRGDYVDASRTTVSEFLDRWERDWAVGNLSPKSFERYTELLRAYVRPNIGAIALQKLKPAALAELYAKLLREGRTRPMAGKTGLSAGTVRYVHRVLHRALGHAERWALISSNPCELADPPAASSAEIEIMTEQQVRDVLAKLRGKPIYTVAALGLATGARRGELLALRWQDVDLSAARMRVERSLEQTKAGLRFKSPKTKHGRRTISLPSGVVDDLRKHKITQAELRLALGQGKADADALVFCRIEGEPLNPNSLTTEWKRLVKSLRLPSVSLHSWRHSHASQLIAAGMDVLTISRRLGHGSPSITLNTYGHLFSNSDDRAAQLLEKTFSTRTE